MDQPIRVLNLFCELNRGGAETFVMNIYRKIDRSRVQFDFLVFSEIRGAYEEEILSLGGRIYRIPPVGIRSSHKHRLMARKFFSDHPEYRIVHSHVSELGAIVFQEAARFKVPVRICHAHSAPRIVTWKTPVRYLFKKYMLQYSNVLLACSEDAGKWQYGGRKYTLIRNGIDTKEFNYNIVVREDYKKAYGLENAFVLGHVGRFEKPKNHEFLISLFRKVLQHLPDAKLVLVGDGSLRNEIEKMVSSDHLEQNVLFLGVRDDINSILQMFDVFLFPSLFEGLGIALIEAQCSGLKCLASDTVPKEANPTGLVEFLPLKEQEQWLNQILKLSEGYQRRSLSLELNNSGYDILGSAQQLQNLYLNT